MSNVVPLRTNGVKEILQAVSEMEPDELVMIAYKDGEFFSFASEVESRIKIIGTIEMLKHDLLNI